MNRTGRRLTWTLAALIGVAGITATTVYAQRIWAGYYGRTPPKFPTATTFDGNFHFCRALFTSDHREKQGWGTDYPGADINLSVRLSELTKIRVTMTRDTEGGEGEVPDAVVVRLTDDALFQCPFAADGGCRTARFSDLEARGCAIPAQGRVPVCEGLSRHVGAGAIRRGDRPRVAARASTQSSTSRRPIIRCGTRCSP